MKFRDIVLNESLKFVDLPELCKKWKSRFGYKLVDCANMNNISFNGMEVKFNTDEVKNLFHLDTDDIKKFFNANGWDDCSTDDRQLIFRQAREPVDNIKPYYELELANNPDKAKLYKSLLKELDFSKFYHISMASPDELKKTGGLRCKNKNRVRYENRIYMISGKMALKTLIIDGMVTEDTPLPEAQELLDKRIWEVTEKMIFDMHLVWKEDHGTDLNSLYVYEIDLPNTYPVYKDPEYDDEDDLSACACFTNQNIPSQFIKYIKKGNVR